MNVIRVAAVLACAVFLAGCLPVTSKTPVGSTASLGADKALIGTWKGHDPNGENKDEAFLHFMASKDDGMSAALIMANGNSDDGWMLFDAKAAALGKNKYLNALETFDKDGPAEGNLKNANIPLLYVLKGRTLTLYLLDEDKTKAAIQAGKLKGTIENTTGGDIAITSDAAELDAFMATPEATGMFKVLLVLKKVD